MAEEQKETKEMRLKPNKTRKTYAMPGVTENSVIIKMMGSHVRVNFRDGFNDGGRIAPATFTTDNPIVQIAIENSDYYKLGKIVVHRVIEEAQQTDDAPSAEFPSVKTDQAARVMLMRRYNVPIGRLQDRGSILAAAKEVGVSFPNLQ